MEEIAHGVREDHLRRPPTQGLGKFLGHKLQVKALLVGMAGNAAKPFCEDLSVTVFAARADFGATADGVPGCVGPFDMGIK